MASVTYAAFLDSQAVTENIYASAAVFPSSPVVSSLTPTILGIQPGDVVINEINWAGSNAQSSDEWIELRNMTAASISLDGWTIENLGSGTGSAAVVTIPPGKTISSYGLFIISRLTQSESRINVSSDLITSSISLSNAGEQLRLKTASGTLIDVANPVSGSWLAGSTTVPRKSMERKLIPGDGSSGSNWQSASTHTGMDGSSPADEYGTPGYANGL